MERAAALLASRRGLRVEGATRSRVQRAVRDGAAASGRSPAAFVDGLLADRGALDALLDAVTVQETGFFRDAQHFDVLARRALPTLPDHGLVWCAGCANGQEAWSLAMALEEAGAAAWHVLATDVSSGALARAEAGRYSEREVAALSAARRRRFLVRGDGGEWEIGPRLRGRVRVREHNLATEPPPDAAAGSGVVFCRNVLIYLDAQTTLHALEGMRASIRDDGWLFLGASETLVDGSRHFEPRRVDGTYVYRPRRRRGHRPAGHRGVVAAGDASRDGAAPPAAGDESQEGAAAPAAGDESLLGAAASARSTPGDGRRAGTLASGEGPRAGAAPEPPLPDPRALLAEAGAHAAAGRRAEAATAFRQAGYLAPDDPLPLVGLGLALEPEDPRAAARAFRAARAALARARAEGPPAAELARLLDEKLAGAQRLQSGNAASSTSTVGSPPP
jgi:chemotaxis protein methyltransferase CheR